METFCCVSWRGEKRQTKLEETLLLFVDFIFAGQGLYPGHHARSAHAHHQATPPPSHAS